MLQPKDPNQLCIFHSLRQCQSPPFQIGVMTKAKAIHHLLSPNEPRTMLKDERMGAYFQYFPLLMTFNELEIWYYTLYSVQCTGTSSTSHHITSYLLSSSVSHRSPTLTLTLNQTQP